MSVTRKGKYVWNEAEAALYGAGPLVKLTSVLLFAVLLSSCAKHVPLRSPVTNSGAGWIAAEQKPGQFLVIAKNNEATKDAMKELCSKEYICFGPDTLGEALIVERRRK